MDNFIPEQSKDEQSVPFFDDVTAESSWQGHGTSKSIQTVQSEITEALGRLGGMVTGFQRGGFGNRAGFRIHYTIQGEEGMMWPGKMDIAALPVKPDTGRGNSYETRTEKSLKMALFMLRIALNGSWFLSQMSPGYKPLMPWMLVPGKEHTFSEAVTLMIAGDRPPALPEPDPDTVEGEFEVSA